MTIIPGYECDRDASAARLIFDLLGSEVNRALSVLMGAPGLCASAVVMATYRPAFIRSPRGRAFRRARSRRRTARRSWSRSSGALLSRVIPTGKIHVIAKGGGPNGAAMGPGGKIYVTNNGGLKFVERLGKLFLVLQADDYTTGSIQIVDPETGPVLEHDRPL